MSRYLRLGRDGWEYVDTITAPDVLVAPVTDKLSSFISYAYSLPGGHVHPFSNPRGWPLYDRYIGSCPECGLTTDFHRSSRAVDNQEGDTVIDLEKSFTYHAPPDHNTVHRYEQIRAKGKELAQLILDNSAPSREQSLAITNLEQAIMWANAGIARNDFAIQPEPAVTPAPAPEGDATTDEVSDLDLEPEPGAEEDEARAATVEEAADILTSDAAVDTVAIGDPGEKGDKGDLETPTASPTDAVANPGETYVPGKGDVVNYNTGELSGIAEVLEVVDDQVKLKFDTGIEGTVRLAQVTPID